MDGMAKKIQQLDSLFTSAGRVMMEQQYMFLSSHDGFGFHPENNASSFIVELSQPLQLGQNWSCALVDIALKLRGESDFDLLNVYCDLCDNSVVNLQRLPILRRISFKDGLQTFHFPYYILLSRDQVQRFRIYLTNPEGTLRPDSIASLYCTLHLKRCRGYRSYRM